MAVGLDNVSHRFGPRWALARISLQIPRGEAVLLTGENGAGKTTLLRILATALRPTRGVVTLFGVDAIAHKSDVRPRVGLVTHKSYLYDALTASENLALVEKLRGESRPSRVDACLRRVGLRQYGAHQVAGFSAGMKRRLCFARLLLSEPALVLLDEPFTQLDPGGVELVGEIVRDLLRNGVTLVMSTHDVERGRALCTAHVELSAGRQLSSLQPIEGR